MATKTHFGRFEQTRRLTRGDTSGLRPSLSEVTDGGSFLYAKSWPRSPNLGELTPFWNLESRTLLRLSGYPRADDYFVRLRDIGADDASFYVILDAGLRSPLSALMKDARGAQSVRNLRSPNNRRRLWNGLRKVATGLGMLHAEGTLHRTLSTDCVFADDASEGDFRLSGFEWSFRVSGPNAFSEAPSSVRLRAPEFEKERRYSFATDWFDLGVLAAELLGFPVSKGGRKALERLRLQIADSNQLTAVEKRVLAGLLEPSDELRSSQTSAVLQALSEASTAVRTRALAAAKPLCIGFVLGGTSGVSRAISEFTEGGDHIRVDEIERQLDFIGKDLASATHVIVRKTPYLRYIVNGGKLQYSVQQWDRRERTWDVGYCSRIEPAMHGLSEELIPLQGRAIEARAAPDLAKTLPRTRQRCTAWDAALPTTADADPLDGEQRRIFDFFNLTNQLDALLAAAQIWPIRIVAVRQQHSRTELEVTPGPEEARDLLAISLKMQTCDLQMRQTFSDQRARTGTEAEYEIADEGILGRSDGPQRGRWRFERTYEHPRGVRYVFYSDEVAVGAPQLDEKLFIMPRGLGGTVAQLKRRQRAIDGLRQHAGLLSAIADPDALRRDTGEILEDTDLVSSLDESKQDALRAMWGSQPIFTLQGPPGTGKTRLLESCVLQLLRGDPSRQILVTAHSHEAINNVRRKLMDASGPDGARAPLIVRLDEEDDPGHVNAVANDLSKRFANSRLADMTPASLAKRIREEAQGGSMSRGLRGFELLVRDSANVVLATSNSGELSRMLGDDRRFDWSIIEEAGKAHGFDLALALQSSPKVVLIGDQEQLPPFNFEALQTLLREPQRILEAVKLGARFAPSLVDRTFSNMTPLELEQFNQNVPSWLEMVLFFSDLFLRCEESERDGVKLASTLSEQHRMHPVISDMVSRCFYGVRLSTHRRAVQFYDETPPPIAIVDGGWLPPHPLVFVDLPWVQEVQHATGEEGGPGKGPRYTNRAEADAVVRVLDQLRPIPNVACDLQLLSPYRAQVDLIAERVAEAMAGSLGRLHDLSPPFDEKRRGATVDEFQGNEADVVIVSLVRNNDEKVGRGLGFLADRRRVNVMLSRARHKLILVGSWRFLESRVGWDRQMDDDEELVHVQRLIAWLKDQESRGRVARVPYATLVREAVQ